LEDVFGEKRGVTEVTGVVDMTGIKGMKNDGRKERRVCHYSNMRKLNHLVYNLLALASAKD
jgi:hypothetical protein